MRLLPVACLFAASVAFAAQPPSSTLFPYCWGGVGNDAVYYTQGLMLRQLVLYSNPNKDVAITNTRLVFEYPAQALTVAAAVMSDGPNKVKREMRQRNVMRKGVPMVRVTVPMWDIKPGFTWTGTTPWSEWPGWWSALYIRGGQPGEYRVYWHLESNQGREPEQSAPVKVLPKPATPKPQATVAGEGVGVWVYSLSNYGDFPEVQEGLAETLAAAGVQRAYVAARALPTAQALKARGIKVILSNSWSYSFFAPADPPDDARAHNVKGESISGQSWCPTYVAERGPAWEKVIRPLVTDAIREASADGYMLDYEGTAARGYGADAICFCDRCRAAFTKVLGEEGKTLNWPADVQLAGKWRTRWLDWRCEQGALYVRHIADMAREANPQAETYTWSGGYYKPYPQHSIYSQACSDITKYAKYLTAPTVGTYVYPNDPAKALVGSPTFGIDPNDYGRGIPNMVSVIAWTVAALQPKPVIPCVSGGHTAGGSATPLASIDLLRRQIHQHQTDGVRGIDFWGTGPIEDGRYVAFMAELARANNR